MISDIHANVYGLRAVLHKLKNADIILCAGDVTGYYTFVNETFDLLAKYKVQFIRGNHDDFLFQKEFPDNPIYQQSINFTRANILPENLQRLKKIPDTKNLALGGMRLKMYHGSPWGMKYIYPDFADFDHFKSISADVIILGHTHFPMIKKVGKKIIVNPGSCGQPRDNNPRASFALLDTETGKIVIKRVAYNLSPVIGAVKKYQLSQELIDILERG